MDDDDLIAYRGEKFTIEWYRNDSEECPALEYFLGLDDSAQDKLFHLMQRIGDFGRISDTTKFRHEGDQIYAFKPQPNRFLCFFQKGQKIIVTNAFHKKQQKLPKGEKDRALDCRKDYLKRNKTGDYYHDN